MSVFISEKNTFERQKDSCGLLLRTLLKCVTPQQVRQSDRLQTTEGLTFRFPPLINRVLHIHGFPDMFIHSHV